MCFDFVKRFQPQYFSGCLKINDYLFILYFELSINNLLTGPILTTPPSSNDQTQSFHVYCILVLFIGLYLKTKNNIVHNFKTMIFCFWIENLDLQFLLTN